VVQCWVRRWSGYEEESVVDMCLTRKMNLPLMGDAVIDVVRKPKWLPFLL